MITREIRAGKLKNIPSGAGIYVFYNDKEEPIYVGMSKNLVSRVSSYFGKHVTGKTRRMMEEAKRLGIIRTESELEAILLEAKIVKEYLPKYNAALRDDKSPLYIAITKEELPRIIMIRKREVYRVKMRNIYGPYVNSARAKEVLNKLRRAFPFSQHGAGRKECINSQIGLCNPCPSLIMKEKNKEKKEYLTKKYLDNIRQIEAILEGKAKRVKLKLRNNIKELTNKEDYEEAKEKLEQLTKLTEMTQRPIEVELYLKNPNLVEDIRREEEKELLKILKNYTGLKKLRRIECFDVAHLAGTYPTASMVTFARGEADRRYYRHFRIRNLKKADDVEAIGEVIRRRKKYFMSWGKPDLIIVDGGKGQVGAAVKELKNEVMAIGLVKRDESLVIKAGEKYVTIKLKDSAAKRLVQRLRDESHRFARRYHHKLVKKALIGDKKS